MPPTAPPRRGKNQWAKSWADFFDGKMGNLNNLMGIYGDTLLFQRKPHVVQDAVDLIVILSRKFLYYVMSFEVV